MGASFLATAVAAAGVDDAYIRWQPIQVTILFLLGQSQTCFRYTNRLDMAVVKSPPVQAPAVWN